MSKKRPAQPTGQRQSSGAFDVRTAALQKLSSSGLTEKDAKMLGLKFLQGSQLDQLLKGSYDRAGIWIPYFELSGKPNCFGRARFLELPSGFAGLVEKPQRYAQTANSGNHFYLPPLGPTNWEEIQKNVEIPIGFTEGEFKAACACKAKIPFIGLGGVYNFKDRGVKALRDFEQFEWRGRRAYIVYDSDAALNAQVLRAEFELAEYLLSCEAVPYILRLPEVTAGTRAGLDDYIVARGAEAFFQLLQAKAIEFSAAHELFQLNNEVLFLCDPSCVLERATWKRLSHHEFTRMNYATRRYQKPTGNLRRGAPTFQEVSAPDSWLQWAGRSEAKGTVYKPGQPLILGDRLNLWKGWGVMPVRGDVKLWQRLLDILFKRGEDDEARRYFEQWLAYPLQHPGTKLTVATMVWGLVKGTGKTMVGESMRRIYGENFVKIGSQQLFSHFNEWAEGRQFAMVEELESSADKRSVSDRLKAMITQKEVMIERKYISTYVLDDYTNYYFTSNHADSLYLEDGDRRYFIHEVRGERESDEFYTAYVKWLEAEGAAALFWYLLHGVDLTGFNPYGHALETQAKREMRDIGRSDLADWVATLKDTPDTILRVNGIVAPFALWTAEDLLGVYDPLQQTRVTVNGLSRALKKGGFNKVYGGAGLPGVGRRVWAIRNAERWLGRATYQELEAEYWRGREAPRELKFVRKQEKK